MTFLNPLAFGFLGAVPLIVLLYLLKVKRRTAPVSTLMFWQRVLEENRRRALFHRLRQLLSLLFHLLIFTLILLALSKPELARFVRTGTSTVLVLDTRARMQAVESDGESRFTKAKRELNAFARHASAQNAVAILTAAAGAQVAAPFSDDEKALQQIIAKLEPTDASGDLNDAIKLANELLASRSGEKRIVVVTDSKSTNPDPKIDFISIGESHENIAITRFAARPLLNSPQTSEVLLELHNFGNKPAHGNVELYFDDALLDVKPFDLAPDAHRVEIFPWLPQTNGRGWLRARLDVKDALATDNEAFAVLPAFVQKHVLLVTRGNWFIEKMLEADDTTKFELLTPDAFTPEMAKDFDAVILDNALPNGFDLGTARGNFLFVKQTPFTANEMLDQPLVSDSDSRAPLMRLVALQNVTFLRSSKMTLPAGSDAWKFDAPLRSFENPLIISGVRGNQRIAAFAFDIAETDLPLRVAFPLLMSNTLQWLAGEKQNSIGSVRAGETLTLENGQRVFTKPQKNTKTDTPLVNAKMVSGAFQPMKNGWYLARNGDAVSWTAVNTFSENESDLRAATVAAKRASHTSPFAKFASWPIWTDLALAAFVLFTLEWWLFHRRFTE